MFHVPYVHAPFGGQTANSDIIEHVYSSMCSCIFLKTAQLQQQTWKLFSRPGTGVGLFQRWLETVFIFPNISRSGARRVPFLPGRCDIPAGINGSPDAVDIVTSIM